MNNSNQFANLSIDSLLRVTTISNKIYLGDIKKTGGEIISLIMSEEVKDSNPDFILFPQFCLTGAYCGKLLYNKDILNLSNIAIQTILSATAHIDAYIVIGSFSYQKGNPISALYLLKSGEIIDVILGEESLVISYNDATVLISSLDESYSLNRFNSLSSYGADVMLLSAKFNSTAGSTHALFDTLRFYSAELACGLAITNGGVGDTSFPYINKGFGYSVRGGNTLSTVSSLTKSVITTSDFDIDIIRADKIKKNLPISTPSFEETYPNVPLKKPQYVSINKDPYLSNRDRDLYLDDLFALSANALYRRLSNIGLSKMIIGISGGLDSTLALLITAHCCDLLAVPRSHIFACTMPGFGTSDTTKTNAHILMEQLGCTILEIPIATSVSQHFTDISHDSSLRDVTFENAQARERTQILLSLANKHGGIVVGTGDLSEEALGFCTFGGDHLSQYNVNVCITKSMLRQLLARLIQTDFSDNRTVLQAILDTPISPELLPPDENGLIAQKTEQILGPYELHDFFLYYHVKYNLTVAKILAYATITFGNDFEYEFIKEKLNLFIKRFYQNQYKRSCSPDGAVITDVCLSNSEYSIPSDYNSKNMTI